MQLFVCGGITLENAKLEAESEAVGCRTEQASIIRVRTLIKSDQHEGRNWGAKQLADMQSLWAC